MRLVIVGTALAAALMVTGAAAQGKMQVTGSKAFCMKMGTKADCAYDSAEACKKMIKEKTAAGAAAPTCVSRSEAK